MVIDRYFNVEEGSTSENDAGKNDMVSFCIALDRAS
jgi:hypothetical protein